MQFVSECMNAFILSCVAAWLWKQAEKHLCHYIWAESFVAFFYSFASENGFNTCQQFVLCFFFSFSLCCFVHSAAKQQKSRKTKNGWFVALLRPQKQEIRIYFGLAAIYYMPSQAKPYQDIALSSFRTRWIIRRLLLGQIKRRFVARQIFSFSNEKEDETKIAIKKYPAKDTHSPIQLLFFQICVWIFRCTIAMILSEHFPILEIALAWILKQNTTQNKRTHVISQQFHSSESVDSILLHEKRLRHQVPFANACYQLYAKCVE